MMDENLSLSLIPAIILGIIILVFLLLMYAATPH